MGSQREMDGLLHRAHLNERQMETIYKVLKSEDLESVSQYINTRYGTMKGANASLGMSQ